jgi:sugar/nucleoside kinase (ribokinase family)
MDIGFAVPYNTALYALAIRVSIPGQPGRQRVQGGNQTVYSLYGVENPLMDVVGHVDHAFLARLGKHPGTMHLVGYEELEALLREVPSPRKMPGGSAANAMRGIAWLASEDGRALRESVLGRTPLSDAALPPAFSGAVGCDPMGDEFEQQMQSAGVRVALARKSSPTGTSVILVTPDGERTMNTFLGACREFQAADLDPELLSGSRMVYLTGYLWDTENQRLAAEAATSSARKRGIRIAFDLADPFAVRRYGPQFRSWIPGKVDILFGNRDELSILTGASCDEDCAAEAATLAPIVVMKVGAGGCLVAAGGSVEQVPGVAVSVVDTTGAGDAFAAGFLFARLAGADPLTSARLANLLASRVVGMEGCCYGRWGSSS